VRPVVFALALLLVACGGDSDPIPPVSVAGAWTLTPTNAGVATLTGCTGDLLDFEGASVADLAAATPECTAAGPLLAAQTGSTFTLGPVALDCAGGLSGRLSGAGTVSSTTVRVQIDTETDGDTLRIDVLEGTAAGSSIALTQDRVTFSGVVAGSCAIEPPLVVAVSVGAPAR